MIESQWSVQMIMLGPVSNLSSWWHADMPTQPTSCITINTSTSPIPVMIPEPMPMLDETRISTGKLCSYYHAYKK